MKFYLKPFVFIKNKITLLKKKHQLRAEAEIIKNQGGDIEIKNNEYIGGTTIEIEFPLEEEKKK